jgi:hypothetical protein
MVIAGVVLASDVEGILRVVVRSISPGPPDVPAVDVFSGLLLSA